jgi:hypothetical protein
MTTDDLIRWREEGAHLPDFMRDFHDQKDLFKSIAGIPPPPSSIAAAEINWMQAHVYTIDRFLWFMARHGYTLQKSRAKLPFSDIGETLGQMVKDRREAESSILRQAMNGLNSPQESGSSGSAR